MGDVADIADVADAVGLVNHLMIKKEGKETYTALVNPASYAVRYEACYVNDQVIGSTKSKYRFNKAKEQTFDLELLFDSTGSLGNIPSIANVSVIEQIETFMNIVLVDESADEKDKYLELVWGKMHFVGVLKRVDINYSHFDATGNPIRATAKCIFSGGEITFDIKEDSLAPEEDPIKVVDFKGLKHPVNGMLAFGGYLTILAEQARPALPKSLRIKEEIDKMIIR